MKTNNNWTVFNFGKYAIFFGPDEEFEFIDTKLFRNTITLYKAKRIWKFIYKIKRVAPPSADN